MYNRGSFIKVCRSYSQQPMEGRKEEKSVIVSCHHVNAPNGGCLSHVYLYLFIYLFIIYLRRDLTV